MGFSGAAIAGYVSAGAAVVGTVMGYQSQQAAKRNAKESADAQRSAQAEQRARAAAQAAQERRQQIREERVRRARIIQGAENGGVAESSGAMGALAGIATNISANLGANQAMLDSGARISAYGQVAADSNTAMNENLSEARMWSQFGDLGKQVYSGVQAYGKIPGTTTQPDNSIFGMLNTNRGMGD